jgi:MFS superfamily sulfate permease-like transporter
VVGFLVIFLLVVAVLAIAGWVVVPRRWVLFVALVLGVLLTLAVYWLATEVGVHAGLAIISEVALMTLASGLYALRQGSPEHGFGVWLWALIGAALPPAVAFALLAIACAGEDNCLG